MRYLPDSNDWRAASGTTRVCAGLFAAAALFQCAVVAGAPLGEVAWGGTHEGALPAGFRAASVANALLLGAFASGLLTLRAPGAARRRLLVALLAFSLLAAVVNAASRSAAERAIWVPFALVQAALTARLLVREPR